MQLLALFTAFALVAGAASSLAASSLAASSLAASYVPAEDIMGLAELMPLGALPPPDNLQLKFIVLGVGTQNYTCTSEDETSTPSTSGALARLYDLGTALKDNPLAAEIIGLVSPLVLLLAQHGQYSRHQELAPRFQDFQHLLGHHYFHLRTPVFALDQLAQEPYPIAQVSKLDETEARPYPLFGLSATDSVDWLFLQDTEGSSQGGVNTVYRVETAGGVKPATCTGQKPAFGIPYVAQYWIYGPRGIVAG